MHHSPQLKEISVMLITTVLLITNHNHSRSQLGEYWDHCPSGPQVRTAGPLSGYPLLQE